ncbi:hypothetical protein [Ruminococcus sp.]|uniref:hypothetical protein n=1 Tax=Ruminococcus sp. TaxID=41978 RepID=UPI0025F4E070|nr:hypothetical protein [Ruminococcus sp.]
MAKRIEFKAYGGTGTLIGRCFLTLLALNAGDLATDDHKDDKCVIYQLDYDDIVPVGGEMNDGTYFNNIIEDYRKLHNRGLKFIAPIDIQKHPLTLKSVRATAYGIEEDKYSLESLFCSKKHKSEIKELLSSSFTTNANTNTEEIERSNRDGCYGDLAVNGFISERLIVDGSFQKRKAYNDLAGNLQDAVIFYAGSTDGGTANTMIDKDILSMLYYLKDNGKEIGHSRQFRVYGLRTTPYSKFKLVGQADDLKITSDILRDKFEMSRGVFRNIKSQNEKADNSDVEHYSYYNIGINQNYWLDGLFIAGSSKLDITAQEARKDNQFHPSHLVEFALAAEAMDAIANRIPQLHEESPHLFAYNDGVDEERGDVVTLNTFFKNASVKYDCSVLLQNDIDGSVSYAKYVRAILLTLVTIKGQMIKDFSDWNNGVRISYVKDIFKSAEPAADEVTPFIAQELQAFLNESKFIVMTFVEMMDFSRFDKPSSLTVGFVEDAVRYLYERDNFNNAVTLPSGSCLSIDTDNGYQIQAIANPMFTVLDEMHTMPFGPGGVFSKANLRSEKLYLNSQGATAAESGRNIANNMIQRTFEVYLNLL